MRSHFIGHYPLRDEEYERLWSHGTVVLDTNSLLNLYRYSVTARNDFLSALRNLDSRLWIPHQVAEEFHRNRVGIIWEQHNIEKKIAGVLEGLANQASGKLSEYMKNAFLDVPKLQQGITKHIEQMKSEVVELCRKGVTEYGVTPQRDPVLLEVAQLYENKIGSPYTVDQIVEIRKAADDRFEQDIPPGYKDAGKGDDRQYGDYVLWRQILDYAALKKSDIILVTDENKEDWWWKSNGETLGPRPELREEFLRETGHICYLYRPAQFLKRLGERISLPLSEQVVEEVRNTSQVVASQEDRRAAATDRRKSTSAHIDKLIHDRRRHMEEYSNLSARLRVIDRELSEVELARDSAREEWQFVRVRSLEATELARRASEDGVDDRQAELLKEVASARDREMFALQGRLDNISDKLSSLVRERRSILQKLESRHSKIEITEDHLMSHGVATGWPKMVRDASGSLLTPSRAEAHTDGKANFGYHDDDDDSLDERG